jgi:hypothetical protein
MQCATKIQSETDLVDLFNERCEMKKNILMILLAVISSSALAEGQHEDLVIPSTDEAVCVKQIQPIIDLWKNDERSVEDAKRLAETQKTKGNCAAQKEYRKMLGFPQ